MVFFASFTAQSKGENREALPYIFSDFLKGSTFASWDELNVRGRHWLDSVANVRNAD
jgi:hypothetical protein